MRNHDDDPLPGDAPELVERDAEVLYVLQRVRRDDGVEGAIAERQLLDVRVAPTDVGMRPARPACTATSQPTTSWSGASRSHT